MNGGSQAVRLPAEFRFAGETVYVRRDPSTGDVILSERPPYSWSDFMALRDGLGPEMEELELHREVTVEYRDPFADWEE
jgi:antitoxin VapB